jgi:hypothetical protein
LYHRDNGPIELGKSENINRVHKASLEEVIKSITFEFSMDGKKLVFIDNQVSNLRLSILMCREFCKYLREIYCYASDFLKHPLLLS